MVKYSKVPFERVREIIEGILAPSEKKNWTINPDKIDQIAKDAGIQFNWRPIFSWEAFEYGKRDISYISFLQLLFLYGEPTGNVILVSDACFEKKEAYVVDAKDLHAFIDEVYPELHGEEFFQPFDSIFICPGQSMISIIQDHGWVTQYIGE